MTNSIQKSILSATLKAETVRIRHLRNEASRHRTLARKARVLSGNEQDPSEYVSQAFRSSSIVPDTHEQTHYDLMWRFRAATGCPSERARCANLALGFLRGTPYRRIESTTRPGNEAYSLLGEIASKACANKDDIAAWLSIKAELKQAA